MLEVQHQQQLLNNNWFAKLPQAYQQYIVQHAKYIEVAKDQAVFHSGDLFDGIYAVLNGAIRLGHVDIEGKEAVAAIAEPIMWFGEISLIDQQPRSHDAIAIQKSTLLHLPKRDVEAFIQATPEFLVSYCTACFTEVTPRFFRTDRNPKSKYQSTTGSTLTVYFKRLWQPSIDYQ